MANLLRASNGLNLTWRRGKAKANNGDTVDCLHLTLSDSNGTIQAKATLNASLSKPKPNTSRITLAHGVDYGLWLELANEKNYAIIYPTIKIKGPVVLEGLKNILGKIK